MLQVAIDWFTKAIELDNNNEKLYCNRSMCFSCLKQWEQAKKDARTAIHLQKSYSKAYYWLIKACFELKQWRDARLWLLHAFNQCGENKEFKQLEGLLTEATGFPCRPRPHDFDIVEELGVGNFTQIFKAMYKPTQKIYALKVRGCSLDMCGEWVMSDGADDRQGERAEDEASSSQYSQ